MVLSTFEESPASTQSEAWARGARARAQGDATKSSPQQGAGGDATRSSLLQQPRVHATQRLMSGGRQGSAHPAPVAPPPEPTSNLRDASCSRSVTPHPFSLAGIKKSLKVPSSKSAAPTDSKPDKGGSRWDPMRPLPPPASSSIRATSLSPRGPSLIPQTSGRPPSAPVHGTMSPLMGSPIGTQVAHGIGHGLGPSPSGRAPLRPPLQSPYHAAPLAYSQDAPGRSMESTGVRSPEGSGSTSSAAASFFARAAQRISESSRSKKKHHRGAGGAVGAAAPHSEPPPPAPFPTNFSAVLARSPPPAPSGLLRPAGAPPLDPSCSKVKVMLRICPMEGGVGGVSSSGGGSSLLTVDAHKRQVVVSDPASGGYAISTAHRGPVPPKMFAFDTILGPNEPLAEVCRTSLVDILHGVIGGSDGCLFNYGHARLGKTFTMMGVDDSPADLGLIPCAISWLFRLIAAEKERSGARFSVRVSAVEVTGKQEVLKDLLADIGSEAGGTLCPPPGVYLREDPVCGTQLENQSELRAPTAERAAYYLDAAVANRTVPEIDEDARNSHLLFTINVYQYRLETTNSGEDGVAGGRSRLHLIDFGSCSRSRDGGGNALSLSALGTVITALLNGQRHVPYRESKLAQLIKESLGGATCRAYMIVHVSGALQAYNETLPVIQLASRLHRMKQRRKVKFASTSSEDSSSCSSGVRRVHRRCGVRMGTLREYSSSGGGGSGGGGASDYSSSSEQSCDTAIYLGSDIVTDCEGPPRPGGISPGRNSPGGISLGATRRVKTNAFSPRRRGLTSVSENDNGSEEEGGRGERYGGGASSLTGVPCRTPNSFFLPRQGARPKFSSGGGSEGHSSGIPLRTGSRGGFAGGFDGSNEMWIDGPNSPQHRIHQGGLGVGRGEEQWVDGPSEFRQNQIAPIFEPRMQSETHTTNSAGKKWPTECSQSVGGSGGGMERMGVGTSRIPQGLGHSMNNGRSGTPGQRSTPERSSGVGSSEKLPDQIHASYLPPFHPQQHHQASHPHNLHASPQHGHNNQSLNEKNFVEPLGGVVTAEHYPPAEWVLSIQKASTARLVGLPRERPLGAEQRGCREFVERPLGSAQWGDGFLETSRDDAKNAMLTHVVDVHHDDVTDEDVMGDDVMNTSFALDDATKGNGDYDVMNTIVDGNHRTDTSAPHFSAIPPTTNLILRAHASPPKEFATDAEFSGGPGGSGGSGGSGGRKESRLDIAALLLANRESIYELQLEEQLDSGSRESLQRLRYASSDDESAWDTGPRTRAKKRPTGGEGGRRGGEAGGAGGAGSLDDRGMLSLAAVSRIESFIADTAGEVDFTKLGGGLLYEEGAEPDGGEAGLAKEGRGRHEGLDSSDKNRDDDDESVVMCVVSADFARTNSDVLRGKAESIHNEENDLDAPGTHLKDISNSFSSKEALRQDSSTSSCIGDVSLPISPLESLTPRRSTQLQKPKINSSLQSISSVAKASPNKRPPPPVPTRSSSQLIGGEKVKSPPITQGPSCNTNSLAECDTKNSGKISAGLMSSFQKLRGVESRNRFRQGAGGSAGDVRTRSPGSATPTRAESANGMSVRTESPSRIPCAMRRMSKIAVLMKQHGNSSQSDPAVLENETSNEDEIVCERGGMNPRGKDSLSADGVVRRLEDFLEKSSATDVDLEPAAGMRDKRVPSHERAFAARSRSIDENSRLSFPSVHSPSRSAVKSPLLCGTSRTSTSQNSSFASPNSKNCPAASAECQSQPWSEARVPLCPRGLRSPPYSPAKEDSSPPVTGSGLMIVDGRLLSPYHLVTEPRSSTHPGSDSSSVLSSAVTGGGRGGHGGPSEVGGSSGYESMIFREGGELSEERGLVAAAVSSEGGAVGTKVKGVKILRKRVKGRSRSAPAARGRSRDNSLCVAASRLSSVAPQRVLIGARGGGEPPLGDWGGAVEEPGVQGGQGGQGGERWRQKEAEFQVLCEQRARVDELLEYQARLRRELRVSSALLMMDPASCALQPRAAPQPLAPEDPGYLPVLERDTALLERRLHAWQARIMFVTCFDIAPPPTAKARPLDMPLLNQPR